MKNMFMNFLIENDAFDKFRKAYTSNYAWGKIYSPQNYIIGAFPWGFGLYWNVLHGKWIEFLKDWEVM